MPTYRLHMHACMHACMSTGAVWTSLPVRLSLVKPHLATHSFNLTCGILGGNSDDDDFTDAAIAKRLALENRKLKRELKAQNTTATAKGKATAAPAAAGAAAEQTNFGSAAAGELTKIQVGTELSFGVYGHTSCDA